jgi:hypothetical protein
MGNHIAQLVEAIHVADGQLAAAEARLCQIESCVRLTDVMIANVRRLAAQHGIVLNAPRPRPSTTSENLSEADFAARVGVSVRTIKNDRKLLTEGVHFYRHKRRVLYHFPEARDFLRDHFGRGVLRDASANIDRLAVDELTQRRARVALRKARSRG